MVQSGPDFGAIKKRQQQMWATGDFAEIGAQQVIVGERLCEAVDLRPGSRVLDVACGSGTAALAAARRFGEVTGIDFVPALLERGRERAAAERLMVEFLDGDAEALPFVDAVSTWCCRPLGRCSRRTSHVRRPSCCGCAGPAA